MEEQACGFGHFSFFLRGSGSGFYSILRQCLAIDVPWVYKFVLEYLTFVVCSSRRHSELVLFVRKHSCFCIQRPHTITLNKRVQKDTESFPTFTDYSHTDQSVSGYYMINLMSRINSFRGKTHHYCSKNLQSNVKPNLENTPAVLVQEVCRCQQYLLAVLVDERC